MKTKFSQSKIKYILVIFILFFNTIIFSAAFLEIDNEKPNLDSIFRIIITSTDPNVSSKFTPDLTQIKNNFEILNQSEQTSKYMMNGVKESRVKWILTTLPKKSGKITIKQIQIGSEKTNPLTFTVTNTKSKTSDIKKFDIKIIVDKNKKYYVNSAIPITIKALIYKEQQIDNLNLHSPDLKNINLIKIDDFKTERYINNKPYIVYTLSYLLFSQKTGNIKIPNFRLSGNVLIPENSEDDFFGFQRYYKKPFNVISNTPELNIKAIPPEWKNSNWLNADNIKFEDEFSPKNLNDFKQGDALTRTITITATNADSTAFPSEIIKKSNTQKNNNAYKMYIDNPQYKQTIKNNKIYSSISQSATYIFNSSGEVIIPEINIPWWNISKNEVETLKIEAKKINIKSVTGFNDSNKIPTSQTDNQINNNINGNSKELKRHAKTSSKENENLKWYQINTFIKNNITSDTLLIIFYILGLLVITLLILSVILSYLYNKQRKFITYIKSQKYSSNINNESKKKFQNNNIKSIEKNLYMSCQNNIPQDIYYNLNIFAEYHNININKILESANSEFKQALKNLQEYLFSNKDNDSNLNIDGKLLWKLFKNYKKKYYRNIKTKDNNSGPDLDKF